MAAGATRVDRWLLLLLCGAPLAVSGGGKGAQHSSHATPVWSPTDPRAETDEWGRAMLCWLERCVVGLQLCPWANEPLTGGGLRVVVARGGADEVLYVLVDEMLALAETSALNDASATTLVGAPNAFVGFDEYLEASARVEELIERAGLSGVIQLATFHPEYCFEGSEPDDASNWTNRAPLPVFHLLRERDVSRALRGSHATRDDVWQRNVEHVGAIGNRAMSRLVRSCKPRRCG